MVARGKQGRFVKTNLSKKQPLKFDNVILEHNYCGTTSVFNSDEFDINELPNNIKRDGCRDGMRVIDLGYLLDNLKYCSACLLGPVPLTSYNVIGELVKGFGGYLYVKCQNIDCGQINRVPYCKAMIDSVGGAGKVNNLLSTLNIKPIHRKNLQHIERRSGTLVENVAEQSMKSAAQDAFEKEMSDIVKEETEEADQNMVGLIDDLGACPMPDASPSLKERIQPTTADFDSPVLETAPKQIKRKFLQKSPIYVDPKAKRKLMPSYPCKRRYGMSCAVDTAWQKRGFDSQTG